MERIMKEINQYILEKFKIAKDIKDVSLAEDIVVSFFCSNDKEEKRKIINIIEKFFNKYDISETKDLKNIILEDIRGIDYKKILSELEKINFDLFCDLKLQPHEDFIKYYKEVRHSEYRKYNINSIYIYEKDNIMNICNTQDKFHYSLILEANEKN